MSGNKRQLGRPPRPGSEIVNIRIPIAVYDAYCVRSFNSMIPVRTIMKRTLMAGVRREDLNPKQLRAMAMAMLMQADDVERQAGEPDRRKSEKTG